MVGHMTQTGPISILIPGKKREGSHSWWDCEHWRYFSLELPMTSSVATQNKEGEDSWGWSQFREMQRQKMERIGVPIAVWTYGSSYIWSQDQSLVFPIIWANKFPMLLGSLWTSICHLQAKEYWLICTWLSATLHRVSSDKDGPCWSPYQLLLGPSYD